MELGLQKLRVRLPGFIMTLSNSKYSEPTFHSAHWSLHNNSLNRQTFFLFMSCKNVSILQLVGNYGLFTELLTPLETS